MARKAWSEMVPKLDEAVDDRLGDDIFYSINGGRTFTAMKAFVLPAGAAIGQDDMGNDIRFGELSADIIVKIRRSLLPNGITRDHRLKGAALGNDVYRPCDERASDQGRYFVFAIQKDRR